MTEEPPLAKRAAIVWEYATVEFDDASRMLIGGSGEVDIHVINYRLNELRRDGWELVSCVATHRHGGSTHKVLCMMKRPAELRPPAPPAQLNYGWRRSETAQPSACSLK